MWPISLSKGNDREKLCLVKTLKVNAIYLSLISFFLVQLAMLRGSAFSEQNFCFSHGSKHYLGMEDSLMFRHVHKCYVGETTLQHLTWYMKIKWSRCRNNYLKSKCNVLKESQIPSFLP